MRHLYHVATVLSLCTSALAAPPTTKPLNEFVTSYWLGPPPKFTTLDRYREIKDANFNLIFPPGGDMTPAQNKKLLDIAKQLDLKVILADPRIPTKITNNPTAKANLDTVINDYSAHPALLAWFIMDEPSAQHFAGLAEVAQYLRDHDPAHPAYINLFPTYAAPWAQLGTETYEQYLDDFIKQVHPFVLSYDHYHFRAKGDGPDFFRNLAEIRNAAIRARVPFWNIVLNVQHYDYRHLTEPELRYEAMQSLAFGARGLLWYTYWYPAPAAATAPDSTVAHAMINFDGSRDPHYDMIKQINADARAIGNELLNYQSWATFHTGPGATLLPPQQQKPPITSTSPVPLTLGVFAKPNQSPRLALIASRDYTTSIDLAISITSADPRLQRFDPTTRRWSPVSTNAATAKLHLAPAQAALLRW